MKKHEKRMVGRSVAIVIGSLVIRQLLLNMSGKLYEADEHNYNVKNALATTLNDLKEKYAEEEKVEE